MDNYKEYKIFIYALDPIHVGAGGTQMGHVDNLIVREIGTNLPKIPGTAISGMSRGHAGRQYQRLVDAEYPCAGQKNHCGKCPVCRAYGTATEGKERQGAFSFQDAQILFFPLYSYTHGPVWVAGYSVFAAELAGSFTSALSDEAIVYATSRDIAGGLALGRRLFEGVQTVTIDPSFIKNIAIESLKRILNSGKIAIVPDDMFSKLVNENLEVRTSVSINPETGAAESGALFTYEAIPRGALLVSGGSVDQARWNDDAAQFPEGWKTAFEVVSHGFAVARLAGIGGMGTRGFGRADISMREV